MENIESLIKSYIKYSKDSKKYENRFWAWEKVHDYVDEEPEIGFMIILKLIEEAGEDKILANIAAGTLEDFVKKHHMEYFDKIENELRRNPKFRRCMTGVWLYSGFPKDKIERIRKYVNTIKDPL